MFESLVWGIVQSYAHKYLKGFRAEDLKISLWAGMNPLPSLSIYLSIYRSYLSISFVPTRMNESCASTRLTHSQSNLEQNIMILSSLSLSLCGS